MSVRLPPFADTMRANSKRTLAPKELATNLFRGFMALTGAGGRTRTGKGLPPSEFEAVGMPVGRTDAAWRQNRGCFARSSQPRCQRADNKPVQTCSTPINGRWWVLNMSGEGSGAGVGAFDYGRRAEGLASSRRIWNSRP